MSGPVVALILSAGLFSVMGVASIVAPTLTTAQFGIRELDRDGRNEVRAVYGGFGLAMAGVLVAAALTPGLRGGVALAVGLALGGTAAGRVLSATMDRAIGTELAIAGINSAVIVMAVSAAMLLGVLLRSRKNK